MTDEQRAEIARLAGEAHDKAERYRAMGYMNVPTDPDEARKQSIAYALAAAEAAEARASLDAALSTTPADR